MSRRFHLSFGDLEAFFVDPRVGYALDFEPGPGACGRDELDDGGVVCERSASPILRNATEQAVLDILSSQAPIEAAANSAVSQVMPRLTQPASAAMS